MTTLGELLRGEVRQKAVLKTPIHGTKKSRCTLLRLGALGLPSPHLERGLWVVSKANAWWTSHLCNPVELILKLSARYKNGSQVQSELGTKYMIDSLRQTKLYEIESGFGNFECYFTCGERLLVCEIERYALDIFSLTFTHNMCSGTKLLDLRWSLSFSQEFLQEIGLRQVWGYLWVLAEGLAVGVVSSCLLSHS